MLYALGIFKCAYSTYVAQAVLNGFVLIAYARYFRYTYGKKVEGKLNVTFCYKYKRVYRWQTKKHLPCVNLNKKVRTELVSFLHGRLTE